MDELTCDEARRLFRYDPETGHFYWAVKYSRKVVIGKRAGSIGGHGYRRILVDRRSFKEHRLAWLYVHGRWPEAEIDHINGVRDDNRICNLREATAAENRQNLRKRRDNTSGHTGVIRERRIGKWMAVLQKDKKLHTAGYFDTIEEAAAAYAAAKAELHTFQPVARQT